MTSGLNAWIHFLKPKRNQNAWHAHGFVEHYGSEVEWSAIGKGSPLEWSFTWRLDLLSPKEARVVDLLILEDERGLRDYLSQLLNMRVLRLKL